jgi:hypothetical protein
MFGVRFLQKRRFGPHASKVQQLIAKLRSLCFNRLPCDSREYCQYFSASDGMAKPSTVSFLQSKN